jgi:phospholipase/carboxylesterase
LPRNSEALGMSDEAIDDLTALLPPLLESLDALGFFSRHFDPARFDTTLATIGAPDEALRIVREKLHVWPEHLAGLRTRMETASDATLEAFAGLRAAPDEPEGLRAVMRALRKVPRALDALYPLARRLPPISRFFLEPADRGDAHVEARLAQASQAEGFGVSHVGEKPGARGGFSIYVPEFYTPDVAWPVVFALHGGGGDGFSFLWSWLPTARAKGAIVVAPTAIGRTWALMGEDVDTPNLLRILAFVRERLNVDPARLLLTGMSDGGTFCYVSGLEAESPFTHLAPVSAAFHSMLADMADADRLSGLPIAITHGARDWMFDVSIARDAQRALASAGARVNYREMPDLAHAFPREICADLLAWMDETKRTRPEEK